MKYVDEYRDPVAVRRMADAIHDAVTRPHTLMEVCGGQTRAIVRFGLDQLLPESVRLLHGPGCPVCVTPPEKIERAIELALRSGVTLCSFGDMLRVPGASSDLLHASSRGGDVRPVYSPLDALAIARAEPDRQVVFFAVGFETTAPAVAMAVHEAARTGVDNFSVLVSHVLVPPAIEAILSDPDCAVQGFLAAGHVCTITGTAEYQPLVERYGVPIVVTGFEPLDLLEGVLMCVRQLEAGRADLENQYARSVAAAGNVRALEMMRRVFRVIDRAWRGIGELPLSGYGLSQEYARFDAEQRFELAAPGPVPESECIAGDVLRGKRLPVECPAFGTRCTPDAPLGAPMVSAEGACAAYHRYRRSAS